MNQKEKKEILELENFCDKNEEFFSSVKNHNLKNKRGKMMYIYFSIIILLLGLVYFFISSILLNKISIVNATVILQIKENDEILINFCLIHQVEDSKINKLTTQIDNAKEK